MSRFTRYALCHGAAWAMLLGVTSADPRNIWHVDAGAGPFGDGRRWRTAFGSLEAALAVAEAGDHVWVATGEYRPTRELVPGDPRSATFHLKPGVSLFGGFDGTETSFADRAGRFARTRLSGDIGARGDVRDNAYHVVFLREFGPGLGVTLDGFVIVGGNALGAVGSNPDGGGVHSQNAALRISHCTLADNRGRRGGALYAQAGSVTVKWCRVFDNRAMTNGGGIWVRMAGLRAYNSYLARNRAGGQGGAVFVGSSPSTDSVQLQNCVLADNLAVRGAAGYVSPGAQLPNGVTTASGKATWVNCTVAYNLALESGGGLEAATAHPIPALSLVDNSILWENAAPVAPQLAGDHAVAYSTVQGGVSGGIGNLQADPAFLDPARRNLRLGAMSPVIDAGDAARLLPDLADVDSDEDVVEPTPLDLRRSARIVGSPPALDMGAYESEL